MTATLYNDTDAARFELIHEVWERHIGSFPKVVLALLSSKDKHLIGLPWSIQYLEQVLDSAAYQAWKRSYKKMMLSHAEVNAYRFMASPPKECPPQVVANIAIALAKGDERRAVGSATRARREMLTRKDPEVDVTETATLIGATDDD